MNELIREIAVKCAGSGLGNLGEKVFIEDMPEDIKECIMLVAAVGPPPHDYVDTERIVIDFWARSAHNDRATAMLRQVYELFVRKYDYNTTNWHIYWSNPLGSIVDAGRDAESSKLKRLSVQFICRNLNNIG